MTVVPVLTPLTEPPDVMVATAVLLLAQVPPPVASEREMEEPVQTPVGPEIAAGSAFTETVVTEAHPADVVYMMLDVPALTAVNTPDEFTVATDVFELVHVLPDTPVSVVEVPWHIANGAGKGTSGLTVTDLVTKHPPDTV